MNYKWTYPYSEGNPVSGAVQNITKKGLLKLLIQQGEKIMATQAEVTAELVALKDQNEKAKVEILAKLAALEAASANAGQSTPEEDAALADLKASIQGTDDIVPDAA
jgi:type II secretory pathway component PulF